MKLVTLGCCLALVGVASSASAQSRRIFPDAQCSYALPGPDWEWAGVKGVRVPGGELLALARSRTGLLFTLQVDPVRGEKPDRRSYRTFKAGLEGGGQVRAADSRPLLFRGVPSYHIELEEAGGHRGSVRAIYANDRLYALRVVARRGTPPTDDETTAAFGGFEFVGTPRAMLGPEDLEGEEDGPKELGERAGRQVAQWLLGPAGLVLLILFGAWLIIWVRR